MSGTQYTGMLSCYILNVVTQAWRKMMLSLLINYYLSKDLIYQDKSKKIPFNLSHKMFKPANICVRLITKKNLPNEI